MAIKIIKKISKKELIDFIYDIDLNDENLYKEVNDPDSIGIFQLTGYTAKIMVNMIKPKNFDEIVACNAFARPGTSSFAPEYVKNRDSETHNIPEPIYKITKDTNGVILYQESVMSIFNKIGGFSLEECIQGDEKITTNIGNVSIKEIVENNLDVKVLSYNEESKEKEWKEIKRYLNNGERTLIEIEFENGETLKCTPDHKIFTQNRGWVKAEELTDEDELFHNPS